MKPTFLGLDFLIDKSGQIYFIEANSFPGLLSDLKHHYKKCQPLIDLVKFYGPNIILAYTQKMYHTWREPKFINQELKKITNNKSKLCLIEDINYPKALTDSNARQIEQGYLLTPLIKLKKYYKHHSKIRIINSPNLSLLTQDKYQTMSVAKNIDNVYVPRTFNFKTKNQLTGIVNKRLWKQCVIKPRYGQKGEGVKIINNTNNLSKLKLQPDYWLAQEKININKKNGYFWDIRSFVVNGNYSGCITRISKNPVVNVSLGGDNNQN